MWKPLARIAAACALFPALAAAAEPPPPPKVVASLQPLHSIAAMIMDGIAEPELLVTGAASEHGYALKPSDMRKLEQAQVLVLVDEHYETFLAKPLKAMEGRAAILAMAELPGALVLSPREGGAWDEHDEHDDHGKHEKHPGHDHGALDGHMWLDPTNARLLATALTETLIEIDPARAAAYRANETNAMAQLDGMDQFLREKTAPIAQRPYAVFHDAYQYFEKRYGLHPVGSITIDPDRPPSPKRLAQLRDKLIKTKAACVFREPQFPAPMVETLAKAAGAKAAVLDPQGADIAPGPFLYSNMMIRLATSLTECLNTH